MAVPWANENVSPKLDKILGMFYGHALGDALGFPQEFQGSLPYTGRLEYAPIHKRRFQESLTGVPGQVSDDTEMTLSLLHSLLLQKNYQPEHVVASYQEWSAHAPFQGKNTRALFKGVSTYDGFQKRWHKQFSGPVETWSQSNGSLMRCTPLFLLPYEAQVFDCQLSNPHPHNIECSISYLQILRQLYRDETVSFSLAHPLLIETYQKLQQGILPDLQTNRGWVLHAWAVAILATSWSGTYADFVKNILVTYPRCDTDTVAAISGAVLGMRKGLSGLLSEIETAENLRILYTANYSTGQLPRPDYLHPKNYWHLAPQYLQVFDK